MSESTSVGHDLDYSVVTAEYSRMFIDRCRTARGAAGATPAPHAYFYETKRAVTIRAIGVKDRERVTIGGVEIDL